MSRTLRNIKDIKSLYNKKIKKKLNTLTEEEILQKLERGQMPATAVGVPNTNDPKKYQIFDPHGKKMVKRKSHKISRQHNKKVTENELIKLTN